MPIEKYGSKWDAIAACGQRFLTRQSNKTWQLIQVARFMVESQIPINSAIDYHPIWCKRESLTRPGDYIPGNKRWIGQAAGIASETGRGRLSPSCLEISPRTPVLYGLGVSG
jgi:hypothetical protein